MRERRPLLLVPAALLLTGCGATTVRVAVGLASIGGGLDG